MNPLFHLHLKFCQLMRAQKWQQAAILLDQIELAMKDAPRP
jgi:hypothetical protein